MEKKVGVVIVTYNSENHIFDCLASIFNNNDIGDDLEVIVVDNCSQNVDTMEESIRQIYGAKVNVIRNLTNGGYGQGNNIGIQYSNAPVIMIMNPDVRLTMPLFRKIYSIFESNSNYAVVGIKQHIPGGHSRSFGWSFRQPFWLGIFLMPLSLCFNIYLPRYMFFHGSCFFLRKKYFEKIGLFDEKIFMYNEEEDIHWRIIHSGYNYKYIRDLVYEHHHQEKDGYHLRLDWRERDFQSKMYLCQRDSLSEIVVINRLIKNNQYLLFKEKLKSFVKKGDNDYIVSLNKWINYLKLELSRRESIMG